MRSMDTSFDEEQLASVAVGRSVQRLDLPSHSLFSWCDAILFALVLTSDFDSGGALKTQRILRHIPVRTKPMIDAPAGLRLLLARKDAMNLKAAVNLLFGPRLCFANSFAICAGLRRLGFPCHVAVGYEQIHQYTETPMDAYVIYEGEPVSTTSEVKYSFVTLLTYGQGG